MAADDRRSPASLDELLHREPYRFEFYQAVALIEQAGAEAARVGETAEPQREALRFDARISSAFPPSEIHRIDRPTGPGAPTKMTVNFLGLAAPLGPLPAPLTEIIQERLRYRDTAFKSFLDIFNHRLISLMYRARKINRFWIGARSPADNPVARYLFALIGLGTGKLAGRMAIADRALLPYAGLLARTPRTLVGLRQLIVRQFGVPAEITPFHGGWMELGTAQRTVIGGGAAARNNALGHSAVVGARVWDQTAGFEVAIGPVPLAKFRALLPWQPSYRALTAAIRFYAGDEYASHLRLSLDPTQVPESRLSAASGPRLGWTSWLKLPGRGYGRERAETRLVPHRLVETRPFRH
ncbi:MAG: type VI secretion system baseplate subunit TssG [Alphaproteobacteria bacterium]|nr:type VI secretion system baseplate subunit TssG [Alphaproteobacteria bacterium]